jgi:uracil DNA glycosylase
MFSMAKNLPHALRAAVEAGVVRPAVVGMHRVGRSQDTGTCELTTAEDIYSWSRFCPLADVRVIIVGE